MHRTFVDYRIVRFFLVGALNSVFGFFVFSAVACIGQGTVVALLAGNAAGLVFNFFSTGRLVFRTIKRRYIPRFSVCYTAMLLINISLLATLTPLVGSEVWAQAILTLPMALLSYGALTFWVYRPTVHHLP